MGKIQGKVAVITGAASGMGRATALRFVKEGAAVVLTDLNAEGGESTVAECTASGGRAVFQRADVTVEADIKAAVPNLCRCGVYPRLVRAIQRAGRVTRGLETIAAAPVPGITQQDAERVVPAMRGGE